MKRKVKNAPKEGNFTREQIAAAVSSAGRAVRLPHWVETYGTEPDGFKDTDFGWIHWKAGYVLFTETYGNIDWSETTHFYPDDTIKEPKF